MKKLYVGNIPYEFKESDLLDVFSEFGEVTSAIIITDRNTGRSRGFGFVEMSVEDADKAIEELAGKEVAGRKLVVNEARSKE